MTQQWNKTISDLAWLGFSCIYSLRRWLGGKWTQEKPPGGHFYSPEPEHWQPSAACSSPVEWVGDGISELVRPLVVKKVLLKLNIPLLPDQRLIHRSLTLSLSFSLYLYLPQEQKKMGLMPEVRKYQLLSKGLLGIDVWIGVWLETVASRSLHRAERRESVARGQELASPQRASLGEHCFYCHKPQVQRKWS